GLAASGVPLVAEVNPAHPSLPGAPTLPVAAEVVIETPLVTYDPGPVGTAFTRIGEHVAALIRDGDTVQLGLGRVQPAVLSALTVAGTRFSLHGGMLSTAALPAIEAGGVERIVAGMVLGNAALYARVPTLDNLALLPVAQTHGAAVLARIPNLVAVNSALAVDLAGQATSESLAGRAVSAAGGIDDFQRGARASAGGRAILALPSTARGASRIVAALPAGTRISVTAPNADIVVTEHGVAHLRGQTLAERARRLTAIAAPEHRDTLRAAACAA
ncbi:MAG: acetyl-CoA hydrolase/transferase C-terminal domain-containing protein, partial [Pseudomonadota bacterium]